MRNYIINLADVAMQDIRLSGGKGANLSKLMELEGINVPEGYIVTTEAFRTLIEPITKPFADKLSEVGRDMASLSEEIKTAISNLVLPSEFETELKSALDNMGSDTAFAVRSSATAEDLPDASFAGQQDTFLDVQGYDAIKSAILSCFASLYNERAIAYRKKNQFVHSEVSMAVVVQKMIPSKVSGVMFTADPVTSDRRTVVVEAVEGLGEDLVSGRKTPVTWYIKNDELRKEGKSDSPLSETQVNHLVDLGKRIGDYYGQPQDIEWCYVDSKFYIVQSRPITALYPIPDSIDGFNRCFVSAGHINMMTDTVTPLGMSFMQMISPFQMQLTGGRPYIDITNDMTGIFGRRILKQKISNMDVLMYSSVEQVLARADYVKSIPKGKKNFAVIPRTGGMFTEALRLYRRNNANDIEKYKARMENSLQMLSNELDSLSGSDVLEAIKNDHHILTEVLYDPFCVGAIMATMFIGRKIDKMGKQLLGKDSITQKISRSVTGNITTEMGFALSEISDIARDYPEAISYMENAGTDFNIEFLRRVQGGAKVADAITHFFKDYGMRCTGEIDIAKTRFNEEPAQLIATILTNIKTFPKGHGKSIFNAGLIESEATMQELIQKAEQKWGVRKVKNLKKNLLFYRNYLCAREFPKYYWMRRYEIYKKAILRVTKDLTGKSRLYQTEDAFYLDFDVFAAVVHGGEANYTEISKRKRAYAGYKLLTPPRLIFSCGEVIVGQYKTNAPENALLGLAVSGGIVEGRARVIETMENVHLEKGDIFVTKFTDPSWTPVFVSIAGLVTEVGGMMTHGAVITREYGLPSVVGVINATQLINDGDYIRVNGDDGYIEVIQV